MDKQLLNALEQRDHCRLKELIRNGADVNEKHKSISPLWVAMHLGDTTSVEILLSSGVDVNASVAACNIKPIHDALNGHCCDISVCPYVIKTLMKYGADVNARMDDGFTPLHLAAILGDLQTVQILVDAGANINAKNNQGATPLDFSNNIRISALLRSKGASINMTTPIRDKNGGCAIFVLLPLLGCLCWGIDKLIYG